MMAGDEHDDDDALTWAGGETDSSYVATPEPVRPMRAPKRVPRQRVATPALVDDDDDDDDAPAMSAPVLLSLGVLAGVYLLYTIGWTISMQRNPSALANPLDQAAAVGGQVLSLLAPALWFASTLLLTRDRTAVVRLVWLLVGALALIPWPFVWSS